MKKIELPVERMREIQADWDRHRIEKKLEAIMVNHGMQEELHDIDEDAEQGFQTCVAQESETLERDMEAEGGVGIPGNEDEHPL